MALGVTITKKHVLGDEREHYGTLNLGVYATNGVAFTPGTFGLNKLSDLEIDNTGFLGAANAANLRHAVEDKANAKILAFYENAGALTQVANGVDLSTLTLRWRARGSI